MDTTRSLLADTASRLLADEIGQAERRAADKGEWLGQVWRALEEAGLPAALLPEEAGGYGLDPADALLLLRHVGQAAAPVPLAETMLAGWLFASAGLAVPAGPLTVAPSRAGEALKLERSGDGWRLAGTAERVPWSRQASAVAVVVEAEGGLFVAGVASGGWSAVADANLAGEPRDALTFDTPLGAASVERLPSAIGTREVRAWGAAMRVIAMAGAIGEVLEMTVRYAGERVQFGRPIGKFQAIQQNLAVLAGQAAAAEAAAGMAAEAFAPGGLGSAPNVLAIAAAKARAGEAASLAAGIAHQVHGAIGFTQEHALHHWTKRLWSWRDEYGHEAEWNALVGRHVAAAGADRLWAEITAAA